MALNFPNQQDQGLVSVKGVDLKQVFSNLALENGRVKVPGSYTSLPDVRPASEVAQREALAGWAPNGSSLPQFDPLLGPFSLHEATLSPWAQSLDFLRDIKTASIGPTQLSDAWIKVWLDAQKAQPTSGEASYFAKQSTHSKTDRLVWRSRRILNCLSHILPIVSRFDLDLQAAFWSHLVHDIAKIGAPTDTLWENLKHGFHPLSTRAVWLRIVAIVGVEAALPGLLRSELVHQAKEQIKSSFQSDGLMIGGSIISTLAAGADLGMLEAIEPIETTRESIRRALSCLRRADASLITFGSASSDHARLLSAVLGPRDYKPTNALLASGIGRMSAQSTVVWMRAPQSGRALGASCEFDAGNCSLLTCLGTKPCAAIFQEAYTISRARCRRRDEPDYVILEASATLLLSGKQYVSTRQVRISQDGTRILGEDILRPDERISSGSDQGTGVKEICFSISPDCQCFLSKDRQSVLIVTSQQQAWRFRIQGLDIAIEIRSGPRTDEQIRAKQSIIVCRWPNAEQKNDFSTQWQLVFEGL